MELKKTNQTPEANLIALLSKGSGIELLSGDSKIIRFSVSEISRDLTIKKAVESPKIFQLKKELGEEMLIKILSAVILAFCESAKATRTMDAVDIMECADLIMETYPYEAVKEVVYALKQAKRRGMQFFNNVNQETIFTIINEYMQEKAKFLENEHLDRIALNDGEHRTEAYSRAVEEERRQEALDKRYRRDELNQIKDTERRIEKAHIIIENLVDNINTEKKEEDKRK